MLTKTFLPQRENLGQQVYLHLRDQIYRMEIEPGTRLGVDKIAEQLGVSRSPVRDALMMLVNEGIVELGPSGGYKVIELDRKFIEDAFVVRRALELAAVRLAMQDPDRIRLQDLYTFWKNLKAGKDTRVRDPEFQPQADQELHQTLAEMSGNRLLKDALARITSITWLIGRFSYATSNQERRYGPQTTDEHLELLRAMLSGDVERAVAALDDHLTRAHARALERLDLVRR